MDFLYSLVTCNIASASDAITLKPSPTPNNNGDLFF